METPSRGSSVRLGLPVPFDEESAFDERVRPLLEMVDAACKELKLPMLFSICYAAREVDGQTHFDVCTTVQYYQRGGVPRFEDARKALLDGDSEELE